MFFVKSTTWDACLGTAQNEFHVPYTFKVLDMSIHWYPSKIFYTYNPYSTYFFQTFHILDFSIILTRKKSQHRTHLFPEIIWKSGVQKLEARTYILGLIWCKCLNDKANVQNE